MGLKTYFPEDIKYVIQGIQIANRGKDDLLSLISDPRMIILLAVYRLGVNSTLDAVSAAFGQEYNEEVNDMQKIKNLLDQLDSLESGA
jgi:PhoPQ-activated pathogenicity-related protein